MKMLNRFGVKGFTLIEILVVIALFTTVITIAVGALFTAQSINAKLQQTQVILDGLNLATEEMVRDMRYGSSFYCTNTIPVSAPTNTQNCAGGHILVFKPEPSDTNYRVAYYLDKSTGTGIIFKKEFPSSGLPLSPVQITSPDIDVDNLSFYLKGSGGSGDVPADYLQPVVTLSISGVTKPVQPHVTPVKFTIQTTSSTRKMDQ